MEIVQGTLDRCQPTDTIDFPPLSILIKMEGMGTHEKFTELD
jgi:hypothetical protein